MRDLDSRAQALMKNIDLLADEYLRTQKTLSGDQKKEQLDKIQSLFNKAKVIICELYYSRIRRRYASEAYYKQ